MFAPTSPPIAAPAAKNGLSAGVGAVVVQPQDHAGEVGVVRGGAAEGVVHERRRQERAVRQVLHPAAAAQVAHEDVELAVRAEPDHAAVVVAVLVVVGGAGMPGHGDVVGLPGPQLR